MQKRKRRRLLLPDFGALQCILPDSVQLDVADVLVTREASSTPADDHRGLEEVCSALLQPALLSRTITHCQLPVHTQVPGKDSTYVFFKAHNSSQGKLAFVKGANIFVRGLDLIVPPAATCLPLVYSQ